MLKALPQRYRAMRITIYFQEQTITNFNNRKITLFNYLKKKVEKRERDRKFILNKEINQLEFTVTFMTYVACISQTQRGLI